MKKQIELKEKVKFTLKHDQEHYQVDSSEELLEVSSTNCACISWMFMKLPCRHIFAVRTKLEMDLYSEELCDVRWSVQYYNENQHIFQSDCSANGDSPSVTIAELPVPKK